VNEKKKKAGQQILEHDALRLSLDDDIIEYRRSMEPEVLRNLHETVANAKDTPLYKNKDFYAVMLIASDEVLRQPRTVYLARRSCPTPVYKQSVWKYMHASGQLEFLWSIPDAILYYDIVRNSGKYLKDKECADLAKMVLLMENGELKKWVLRENGEKPDAVIMINNKEQECLTM
jgi:hypothetical protein